MKKKKKMKIFKSKKRKIVSTKSKKRRADLIHLKNSIYQKSIKIQMNMTIIFIKARNTTTMIKNMSQSLLKKLMMILILKKESKTTDCPLQGILQKDSSEEHQLTQEELQLVSEAIFHLKD